MGRGTQVIRQHQILGALRLHRRGLRASELAAQFGVSKRTIFRDLHDLQIVEPRLSSDARGRWTVLPTPHRPREDGSVPPPSPHSPLPTPSRERLGVVRRVAIDLINQGVLRYGGQLFGPGQVRQAVEDGVLRVSFETRDPTGVAAWLLEVAGEARPADPTLRQAVKVLVRPWIALLLED